MKSYRKSVTFGEVRSLDANDFRPSHMKTLYSLCTVPVKIWKEFPGGFHNDTVTEEGYFNAIDDFILEEVLGRKTRTMVAASHVEMNEKDSE